jgi:amino acid adenylation domain-containing protein
MQSPTRFPVSFSQERVWVLQHLEPESRAYHFQATLTFDGELDVAALERSLHQLTQRHEIFRTTFAAVDGKPIQVVAADARPHFAIVDCQGSADAESLLARTLEEELATRFDLERLPLVRWTLVRVRGDRHVLIHVEHHLLHDGWSFNVFLEELATCYRAYASGGSPSLPAMPVQFCEIAARQRAAEEAGAFDEQLAYWRRNLTGAPATLPLTTDRPRPPVQTYAGASVRTELPMSLCRTLGLLGRETRCTPFMTMFAAFAALLHRYTDEVDICVGTGVAARDIQAERAIGMLVNNVTLRTDLKGDPTFKELLARVRDVTLGAFANQEVPFDRVVRAVQPERDRAFHPLYSVMFSFHDSPAPNLSVPGAKVTLVQALDNDTAKIDLNLIGIPHPAGMTLRWEFNRDLFERETIDRMAGHFRHLLESIAAEPERRISRLPMMGDAERRKVLAQCGERTSYERDSTIHALFARQVALTPATIAVQGDGFALTYADLDMRANRLANFLRASGVGPETAVGLSLDRTADLPVALLGILKAGGAYVPLDAKYPRARLEFMLRDAEVALTLTDRSLRHHLPMPDAAVVCLDQAAAEIAACSAEPPRIDGNGDSLAYVMYTSGSTGTPKGVAIVHRGIVRLVRNTDYVDIAAEDVFLQYAPLSFDASTFEIFAPLLNGARLALGPSRPCSFAELGETIERFGVTTLWLTAPLFHRMVETETARLRGVRRLIVGGDVVSPDHARRFLELVPTCTLIDGYGPTENTTFSCCYRIPSAAAIGARLPIGRPIANSTAYVLDRHLQPVPLGVPGELCVGGDGLARGYVNAPELTALRFVPNPYADEADARMYRTGDRARLRADGTIEFLGRLDQQVKIRGFRVEPGEIESTLRGHEGLRDAAVATVAREGDHSLVAYAVPGPGTSIDERSLQAYLRSKLPEHMVPDRIVMVGEIPANASGKLDRAALLSLVPSAPAAVTHQAPASATEMALISLITELLSVDRVGRDDDLFDLGAHSLVAMRIVARVERSFGIKLPLKTFFAHPTVAGLARAIDAAPRSQHDDAGTIVSRYRHRGATSSPTDGD